MEYLDNTGRQRLGDVLKEAIGEDARLSIIASYFTVFAYGELREELSRVNAFAADPMNDSSSPWGFSTT